MKDKILRLIYAELKATNGDTKFHCNRHNYFAPTQPYYRKSLMVESYIKWEDFNYLDYILKFEDGEPDILVTSFTKNCIETEVLIGESFWGKKRYKTTTSYVIKTKVHCGHVSFELTDEEASELFEETEQAYKRYLSLKDVAADKALDDKLELRLKKRLLRPKNR